MAPETSKMWTGSSVFTCTMMDAAIYNWQSLTSELFMDHGHLCRSWWLYPGFSLPIYNMFSPHRGPDFCSGHYSRVDHKHLQMAGSTDLASSHFLGILSLLVLYPQSGQYVEHLLNEERAGIWFLACEIIWGNEYVGLATCLNGRREN